APLVGYTATTDAATGLQAITFTSGDVFTDTHQAASAPGAGDFLWSDSLNWSSGVPTAGASAVMAASGTFDIGGGLSLSALALADGAALTIGNVLLTVGSLVAAETLSVNGGIFVASGSLTLGQFAANPGEVSVSGGSWQQQGRVIVGEAGAASASITNGGNAGSEGILSPVAAILGDTPGGSG